MVEIAFLCRFGCLLGLIFSPHYRCLCAVSKVAGKGAAIVENLIQLFFKRLDAQAVDNKQVVSLNYA